MTIPKQNQKNHDGFSTMALLLEKHGHRPTLSLEEVRLNYFSHLTREMFKRKLNNGYIKLPIIRIEASQKSPRFVHLRDLAAYLDERQREARRIIKLP